MKLKKILFGIAPLLFVVGCSEPEPDFVPVTSITLNQNTATVGVSLTLSATVEPSNATNRTIIWSGQGVANGVLTATTAMVGQATVTATIAGGSSPTSPFSIPFNITVASGGGGGGDTPNPGRTLTPNRTSAQITSDLTAAYTQFRNRFLEQEGNFAWINATGTQGPGTATISEAHGYGMKILALMAGTPSAWGDERQIFDRMNNLRKAMPSDEDSRLMSWLVYPSDISNPQASPHSANATDGCMDMAYALLLAHREWGAQSYLNEAKIIIEGLKASNMHGRHGSPATHRTNLGDWHGAWPSTEERERTTSRTSDWRPSHFRAFAEATSDNYWNVAADMVYTMLATVSNPQTGLMPDFVIGVPARVVANEWEAYVHGEHNWYNFSVNACRVPWFLALDYAHHGTPAARTQLNKITDFLRTRAGGTDPNRIRAGSSGFRLDGTPIDDTYTSVYFMASFASAMTVNYSTNQTFLDNTYSSILDNNMMQWETEYGSAIRLLNMLLITGNWRAP